MKKLNEFLYNVGTTLWATLYVIAGAVAIIALVVWLSRHVTCLNLLDKVCFIY